MPRRYQFSLEKLSYEPIIAGRPHVGCLRICRECGKWFSLEQVRSEMHQAIGEIKSYKCRRCGHEFVDVPELPPRMLD